MKEKKILNFISVLGFAFSLISIPLYITFIPQMISLFVSLIGYSDSKKCCNKGQGLALIGIVISIILLIAAPISIYLLIRNLYSNVEPIDKENLSLILQVVLRLSRFIPFLY